MYFRKLPVVLFLVPFLSTLGNTSETSVKNKINAFKRIYNTTHIDGNKPVIDGKLDDACWQQGEWSAEYVQQNPREGETASQRTIMKILYDDKNIFVAFRCYDNEPSKIQNFTGKRDEMLGDMVGVNFDSYFDHRTGYEFNITAGGTKIDLILNNSGVPDFSWDAVWYAKTSLEDSAWTAEFQIPLNQLRYNNKTDQVWGMHSWRWINRLQEEDQWSLIPRNNNGFIYSFGELHGIKELPRSKRIELLPYTLGKLEKKPIEKGNPFSKNLNSSVSAGLDGKIGVGSDFTIDYTLNPDFGQVEADPSVMNLSAFEIFYDEKRPFFLEGKGLLEYGFDGDRLFYSRRIGHAPSRVPSNDASIKQYVDAPINTSILNAIKFTGKTEKGLSIGVMQSFTNSEFADVDSAGTRKTQIIEPYTNYLLGRIQKDYNSGNSSIGGVVTAINRNIDHPDLLGMIRNAYTGGLDVMHQWKNREYYVSLKGIASHIDGDKTALLETQQAATHYYQRPDANYLKLDSNLTSMNGYGGVFAIGRGGSNKLQVDEKISFRTPGLELNDMGFQNMADYIKQSISIAYKETEPGKVFREYHVFFANNNNWNFGGFHQQNTSVLSFEGQFLNKWYSEFWLYRKHSGLDSRRLWGGPALRENPFWHFGGAVNTDWSKDISYSLSISGSYDPISNSNDKNISPGIGLRFGTRFNMHTDINLSENNYDLFYVNTIESGAKLKHYVMARLNQKTLSFTFRANYSLTTNLSIQYYGSPFISEGNYVHFKEITDTKSTTYAKRFHLFNDTEIQYNSIDRKYSITGTEGNYEFDNPDFVKREIHSNLVARWEYKEGSVLYLVWSHQRADSDLPYAQSFTSAYKQLWNKESDNIFMLKLNYHFSL